MKAKNANRLAPPQSSCSALLACPWCGSEKVMAEGTDKRMAMVCQKCLARGPEVNVEEGRDAAIHEWNKAIRKPTISRSLSKTIRRCAKGDRTGIKHDGSELDDPQPEHHED